MFYSIRIYMIHYNNFFTLFFDLLASVVVFLLFYRGSSAIISHFFDFIVDLYLSDIFLDYIICINNNYFHGIILILMYSTNFNLHFCLS